MCISAAGVDFIVSDLIPPSVPQYFFQALEVETVKSFELCRTRFLRHTIGW